MSDTKREWTDAEVEWAARLLFRLRNEEEVSCSQGDTAHIALTGGYVPPPRPKSVRSQIIEAALASIACTSTPEHMGDGWWTRLADALLARFDVTPKGGA